MRKILTFIAIAISTQGYSQKSKLVEKGDFNMEHHFYKEALKSYKEALATNDSDIDVLHVQSQMAKAYYRLFDYENAEKQYELILKDSKIKDASFWLEFGNVLRNNEKYEEAIYAYRNYSINAGETSIFEYYEDACRWAIKNKDSIQTYNLFKTNLETGGRSLGVAYFKNGLVFSKPQSDYFDQKTTFYDISFVEKENDSTFMEPIPYTGELNRSFYEGAPSLTSDEQTMYYTGNASERLKYKERKREKKGYELSPEGVNILKIYEVQLSDSGWVNKKELPFCSNEYSCTHPSISGDGSTLYFVSNMEGGEGGYDLYVSYKKGESWSKPKNMGPLVNSEFNEMTPFCIGNELYFSSKGNIGYGGSDIFKANLDEDGKIESVENIGKPFNSSKDDFAFVLNSDKVHGYLSSNRDGAHGYDHVYAFEKFDVRSPDTISGIAINRITGLPIKGIKTSVQPLDNGVFQKIESSDKDGQIGLILAKGKEFIVKFDAPGFEPKEIRIPAEDRSDVLSLFGNLELTPELEKDQVPSDTISGIAMNRITSLPIEGIKVSVQPKGNDVFDKIGETDKDGKIELILAKGKEFVVKFDASGFEPKEITVPAGDRSDILALFGSLEFTPQANKDQIITFDKIYFNYDKATIRKESLPALEKILTYLNYYKNITVELSAHTDARGSDSYNQVLSQKRAEATVKWLIEHGIDESRMVPKGYGESKLINKCKNGVRCSDSEHMKNRRVELKVL